MSERRIPPQLPEGGKCKIAFVGEAPGFEEVVKGMPFVGAAGSVFNSMLRNANIDRDACLVTNVFDQKAPDNEVGPWLKDKERLNEALNRLQGELNAAQPNIIVPLGNTALWAFTGHMDIKQFRGAVTKATVVSPGVKLLPTYHPSAIQKQWKWLSLGVGDLIKAKRQSKTSKIIYPSRTLLIEPNILDIEEFLEAECSIAEKLSLDIETGWGQITAFGVAPRIDLAMCIPFVDLRKPNKSYWKTAKSEAMAWRLVERICELPQPKVLQNGTYDIDWLLKKHGISVLNYRYDTRLQHKVRYPELPADLGSMAASYTDLGAWKHFGNHKDKEDA